MSNLFVVNTTMQLLTAYILARSLKSENYLIILHPPNHSLWNDSTCLGKILKDQNVWNDTHIINKWFERLKSKKEIKKHISIMRKILSDFGPIDNVYLGCDKGYQRQLIVEMTGNSSYYRFDEGFGTYWSPKRAFFSKLYLKLRVSLFRYLANVKTNLQYNYDGIGWGKSAIADIVYRPELIRRPSPRTIEISEEKIYQTVQFLISELDMSKYDTSNGTIWYLGNTISQFDAVEESEELKHFDTLYNELKKLNYSFIYKPHPSESDSKIKKIKALYPDIAFYMSYDPVELVLAKCKNVKYVVSHISSSLLYLNQFCNHKLNIICPLKMLRINKDTDIVTPEIIDIISSSGVYFPNCLEELREIVNNDLNTKEC